MNPRAGLGWLLLCQPQSEVSMAVGVLANSFAGLAAKLGLRRQMRNLSLDAYAEQVRDRPDGRQQDN